MGIDRMTMLLTDTANIKEVLLFPAMKPEDMALQGAIAKVRLRCPLSVPSSLDGSSSAAVSDACLTLLSRHPRVPLLSASDQDGVSAPGAPQPEQQQGER